jgi:hypothetical protein
MPHIQIRYQINMRQGIISFNPLTYTYGIPSNNTLSYTTLYSLYVGTEPTYLANILATEVEGNEGEAP